MANNKIFNRNEKEEYYFSQEIDKKVLEVTNNGC